MTLEIGCIYFSNDHREHLMMLECPNAAETCELVIMDRGFDPVAPVIHDWTYEPMVYDLLAPEGSTYRYHAENNRGARDPEPSQPLT